MTTYPQSPRRSGRTTRMLAHAVEMAKQGRAVYILASSPVSAESYRALLGDEGDQLGIKVEFPPPSNFDWETLTLRGAHENCVVLVDHYAIERRYAKVLAALHAYDELNVYPERTL